MEMAGHKWEDLNTDCLVNIFGRVGLESLVLNVQYVCKSWYKATCIPQCWSILDFTEGLSDNLGCFDDSDSPYYLPITFAFGSLVDVVSAWFVKKYRFNNWESFYSFFKFVAKRGNVCAMHLKIPAICNQYAINFMTNECPNIKILQLPKDADYGLGFPLTCLVSKWKRLEHLSFPWVLNAREVFKQLSVHCKNFETLEIINGRIGDYDASALARYLPNLKGLSMKSAKITKNNLITILKSCTKLEFLDARDCDGFDESDGDILNVTSHVRLAKFEGSRFYVHDDSDDYYYYVDNDFEEGYD